ncbi:hypothetical protein BZA77DRAFT_24430 [Pyronema omphalodes]|nr:hypothetical protein BZA77DRAFT_24430 [Pyronema omphalodes]
MSSGYSQLSRAESPIIENRDIKTSSSGETTTSTNSLRKPRYDPAVPRVRILLAPYMSPYVVPLHQVRTWDRFQKTLVSLFGKEIFHQRRIRVTDNKGHTIQPTKWKQFLKPGVTIIVDTSSYMAPDSPVIFKSPTTGNGHSVSISSMSSRNSWHRRSDGRRGYRNIQGSVTAVVLEEREAEEIFYGSVEVQSPLVHIAEISEIAPQNSLKKGPPPVTGIDGKRNTCVSMFMPARGALPGAVQQVAAATEPLDISDPAPIGMLEEKDKKEPMENRENTEPDLPSRFSMLYQPNERKSTWTKISRVLLCVFSDKNLDSEERGLVDRDDQNEKSTKYKPGKERPWHVQSQASGPIPTIPYSQTSSPEPNSPVREWSTSLGRFNSSDSNPHIATSNTIRRSKSLSIDYSQTKTPVKKQPKRLTRSKTELKSKARSTPQIPLQSVISARKAPPPVPSRPAEDLGLTPQYKLPFMEQIRLEHIREVAETSSKHNNNQRHESDDGRGDNEIRASENYGRRRAMSSGGTSEHIRKPLPKLPQKYSIFPPPTLPRHFHNMDSGLPMADSRPPEATPLIARDPTMLRRIPATYAF